jgi:hypothetical protein
MSDATEVGAGSVRRAPRWSFGQALLALIVLMLWVESALALVRGTRTAEGSARLLRVAGLFVLLLPFFGLLVYRWRTVHAFFRSVQVGVVNLVLIGVGACLGVLFQQEDPFQPAPPGAIAALAEQDGRASERPWSRAERFAYQDYESFRNAQAFFSYHLLGHLGLRGAMGFEGPEPGASPADREALANLGERLPDLRSRFGEEFVIAIESQSEVGLRTRARNAEIRALEERWDDLWWTTFVWADRLDLRRAYRSDWYAVLWTVLFCGVLSNTFRGGWRRLLHPRMWGFAVTHVGVLSVIAGGFWGKLTEERGLLELHVGESGGVFQRYDGPRAELRERGLFGSGAPFQVRLDDFRADQHDVLDVVFARRGEDGAPYPEYELARQPKLRVFEGKDGAYDWTMPDGGPRLRLEVVEYAPQARMGLELRAARAEEAGFPVVRVRIEDAEGVEEQTGLLLPSRPGEEFVRVHAPSGTRLRLDAIADRAAAERALVTQPLPRLGRVTLPPGEESGSVQGVDAVPGAVADFVVGGASYRVEVLEATPDFRQAAGADEGTLAAEPLTVPIERAEPHNPAVLLAITAADGREERRWVLERDFQRDDLAFPELALTFRWDAWAAPAVRRLAFFALDDGQVLVGEVGAPDSLQAVGNDFTLPLGDGDLLRVPEAFARGEVDVRFTQIEDADFYDEAPPAIRLKVTTPDGERELLMSAADERFEFVAYDGPDGTRREVALRFREDRDQGELPVEWRSRLTILRGDPDGVWRETTGGDIRVNDYFVHGGYRFFQTNHNPADPTYSGIGVVYDPGIELVLYGLYTVMFGTAAVFLIKPLFLRRQRGED